jgi:putative peptidoglycan lipid II flippase
MRQTIPMTRSLYRSVGIASLIMMGSVFASRVMGLVREMVIAYAGGAGAMVDAYQVAFVLPEILNHIVASGFLSVTFIPLFTGYLARGDEEGAWRLATTLLALFGGLLAALIVVAEIWCPHLVALVAPGLAGDAVMPAAVRMTRIVLPAQLCFFAGGLFTAVQFARERFFIPALAPLIYNLGIICGGLAGIGSGGMDGFAWGVLGGAFAGNFLLQFWGARRAGLRLVPGGRWRHPDVGRYLRLTLPLMLGLSMMFSAEFFLKFFGSYLSRGAIAALNYGLRVMLMMVGLFGQAAGVAAFPYLVRLASEGRLDEMNRLLDQTLRYLSLVLPFAVLLMALRYEVVGLLFERGRFDAEATALTAGILPYLMVGAVGFAAQTVVVRGFYARQNTLLPAIFGTLAVLGSIPLYILGLQWLGVAGVALALSLSALLQVGVLYTWWNRWSDNRGGGAVVRCYGRVLALSGGLFPLLEAATRGMRALVGGSTPLERLLVASAVGGLFIMLLAAGGRLLRIEEIRWLWRRLSRGKNIQAS